MRKQLALALGLIVIGGTTYVLTANDSFDCTKGRVVLVECEVLDARAGKSRYGQALKTKACLVGDELKLALPRGLTVRPGDDACRVLDNDKCTDKVCDGDDGEGRSKVEKTSHRCSCWDGVNACTVGGRQIKAGITYHNATGPGCVGKACVEAAGETGLSWPDTCPQ